MNTDGNLDALNKEEQRVDKYESEMDIAEKELFICIKSSIAEINRQMSYCSKHSVMDKQAILEYVKETLNELLEVK